ncbi:MAG TPA: TIGR03435 family protein [Terracidiphilus sp.]|nr:TIGR03435 family protein [Terracidiphilus sp.]
MTVHPAVPAPGLARKLILSLAFIAFATAPFFPAQAAAQAAPAAPAATAAPNPVSNPRDIADTWQGTLHAGQDLRTVLKITKDDKGGYKAVFYSIDQGAQPLNIDSITLDGSTVKFTLNLVGGKFEGNLSSDGKTINGNWSQGPNPIPLVLTRATPETAWEIPAPAPPPKPMAADADPSFEVATIKPNDSGATRMQGLVIRGRNFMTRASSLEDLISFAYSVQAKQIAGGPGWIDSDRYDINALPDAEGVPNSQQIQVMIRKLLADRFQLKFHHEQREMSAYVLSVARSGEKLKPTQLHGNLPGLGFRPGAGGLTLMARNATTTDVTDLLQILVLDRPVVDRTGLTGRYDIDCTFTPDDSQFGGHPPLPPKSDTASTADAAADAAPSLYDAFEQQLGLKLSAEKTAVDVIVIDQVQKPSPN